MKRSLLAVLLSLGLATVACQPGDDDPTPTLDTAGSGAPLNPGGVEPGETQDDIGDEGP